MIFHEGLDQWAHFINLNFLLTIKTFFGTQTRVFRDFLPTLSQGL
jgi:hypothetical protein